MCASESKVHAHSLFVVEVNSVSSERQDTLEEIGLGVWIHWVWLLIQILVQPTCMSL